MAKLPTRDNLGGMPSARSGRGIARLDIPSQGPGVARGAMAAIDASQRGLASLGNSITRAALTLSEHDEQQKQFDTEMRFQEFAWNQQRDLEERARNIQPGQAREFANTWQGDYVDRAKEFFKDVPDRLKPAYEEKLFKTERDLFGSAATIGRAEQKRFSTTSIAQATDNIFSPRARATSTDQLGSVVSDYDRLIDANPDLTPVEKDEIKRAGRQRLALAHVEGMPAEKQIEVLTRRQAGNVLSPNAQAAISFFESKGLSREDAAAMVWNFQQESGRDINPRLSHDNGTGFGIAGFRDPKPGQGRWTSLKTFAAKNNLDPTDLNTQLEFAWQELNTTEAGTLAKIKAAQGAGAKAAAAIGYFRPRADYAADRAKRSGEATALLGGGDSGAGILSEVSYADREKLLKSAQLKLTQNQTQAAAARNEEIERVIIDGANRPNAVLPARSIIESDPLISEAQRNTLLRQYDAAAKDNLKLQVGMARFADPQAGPFNPYSTDDKDVVDKIYKNFGGSQNPAAMSAVIQRTNMIPKSAALELRGALASGNEKRVGEALQTLSNLRQRADIFEGVEGQKDLEEAADQYRHYVDDRGMSAEDATRRIVLNRDPEHKAKIAARIKGENVDEMIKKNLSVGDLENAFDQSWLPFNDPSIGFNPAQRDGMFKDYAEIARDRYMETGDWTLAKSQAVKELKKVWGETRINGKPVIMRYPPEMSPGMAGLENRSDAIAAQALADIKAGAAQDITRDKIFLTTIPGLTAQAYKSGKATPYQLSWFDKNGNLQTLNPGKAWVADPQAAKAAQSEARRAELGAAHDSYERYMAHADQRKANMRAFREQSRERILADERQVELNLADY